MSHFVFIILVEVILVLSVALVVLLVFNWKKKKQNATEIEQLLSQIEENDATRKEQLVKYLIEQLSMEEQIAKQEVEDFLAAEKRFTQYFLAIQLNKQPASGFYQHSCEFVDKYLQLIAENLPKATDNGPNIIEEAPPEDDEEVNNSEELQEENKESEAEEGEPENIDSDSTELDSTEADQAPSTEAEAIEETNNTDGEDDDEFA